MKKIGIMTWYHYFNYGSVLQAVALSEVVHQMNYEPYLVQYHPRQAVCDRPIYSISICTKKAINKVKRHSYPYDSKEREKLFIAFLNKHTQQTDIVDTYPELNELNYKLDAFICGSDQIWAPICFDDKYFLSYVSESNKIIAYAPSIGLNQVNDVYIQEQMKMLVSRFTYLSVREKKGAELLKNLCNKEAEVVLDPTLLLNHESWNKLITEYEEELFQNEKYMLCYFLGDEQRYMSTVRKMASMMGTKIYIIPSSQSQKKMSESLQFEVGPEEFLKLIKRARYICTDSFHGTAFAINYNISFSTYKRFQDNDTNNQNSRIYSLLEQLGLEDRIIDEKKDIRQINDCNFSRVNAILQKLRESSKSYLYISLQKASEEKVNSTQPYIITKMCCGCGACATVCPTKAVSIKYNEQGFWHYDIETSKCINCGTCQSVCPYHEVTAMHLERTRHLYSFRSDQESTLQKSSSGGAGHEIAALLNREGYWISGVTYDKASDSAKHIVVQPNNEDELTRIQGSKYVQSYSADAIHELLKLPRESRAVFFGTPCQVAGLDKILCKQDRRDKFILVDLICHGVPSQLLMRKYQKYLNKKYQMGSHPEVHFRSGKKGWRDRFININDSIHNYMKSEKKDPFYVFFRNNLCTLESCYDCPYRVKSAADIRIGDYWGPRFESENIGVSMVLANSKEGNDIIKKLPGKLQEHSTKEYWSVQYPTNPPKPLFYKELLMELRKQETNLDALRKKYAIGFEQREKISLAKQKIKQLIREEKL